METEKNTEKKDATTIGKKVYVHTKDGRTDKGKDKLVFNLEETEAKGTENNIRDATLKVTSSVDTKSLINPAVLLKEQDRIVEQELLAEQEKQDDKVQNSNEDDDSSIGSEFVDATQVTADSESVGDSSDHEKTPVIKRTQEGSSKNDTSDVNKRNMEFLKDTWANMVEDEENEARLLAALEKESSIADDEGFQV